MLVRIITPMLLIACFFNITAAVQMLLLKTEKVVDVDAFVKWVDFQVKGGLFALFNFYFWFAVVRKKWITEELFVFSLLMFISTMTNHIENTTASPDQLRPAHSYIQLVIWSYIAITVLYTTVVELRKEGFVSKH